MKKEPTDEEVIKYIDDRHYSLRDMSIEMLVDCALVYDKERQRNDQFHKARMRKCREQLRFSIKDAYETLYPGPITKDDIKITKRIMMSKS